MTVFFFLTDSRWNNFFSTPKYVCMCHTPGPVLLCFLCPTWPSFSLVWLRSFGSGVSRQLPSFSLVYKVLSVPGFLCLVLRLPSCATCVSCLPCVTLVLTIKDCYPEFSYVSVLLAYSQYHCWQKPDRQQKKKGLVACFPSILFLLFFFSVFCFLVFPYGSLRLLIPSWIPPPPTGAGERLLEGHTRLFLDMAYLTSYLDNPVLSPPSLCSHVWPREGLSSQV